MNAARKSPESEPLWNVEDVRTFMKLENRKAVYRLPIPCILLGPRTRRYQPAVVRDFCAKRSTSRTP